jgi:hypothetical protein
MTCQSILLATGKDNTGLHLPVLIGLFLLLTSIVGSVKYFRPQYPKILNGIQRKGSGFSGSLQGVGFEIEVIHDRGESDCRIGKIRFPGSRPCCGKINIYMKSFFEVIREKAGVRQSLMA